MYQRRPQLPHLLPHVVGGFRLPKSMMLIVVRTHVATTAPRATLLKPPVIINNIAVAAPVICPVPNTRRTTAQCT